MKDNFLTGNLMAGIAAEWEKIKAETGGGMRELRTKFYHAVNGKDKAGAIGALLALAEEGQIREAFGEDERFRKFWGGHLEKQTPLSAVADTFRSNHSLDDLNQGETTPSPANAGVTRSNLSRVDLNFKGGDSAAARFANDPANAKDMALFIKYILEKRLEVAEKEAVMIGVVIGNLARKAGELEYQEMAYGEMETGEFRWNIQ